MGFFNNVDATINTIEYNTDYPIGTYVKSKRGILLQVTPVEDDCDDVFIYTSCHDCMFNKGRHQHGCCPFKCTSFERKDGQSVIFKRV